ncbi:MAG: nuclear transport factor 2 family protein [Undibacterium sp.]|nr:nuclear transport factor 2 family protein [Undibacterium sp.]
MKFLAVLFSSALLYVAPCASVALADTKASITKQPTPEELVIRKLDHDIFDAFNHCDNVKEFEKFSHFLANNLEFYHDKDGVSNKMHMLANTKKNVCGKYRRELVEDSLKIYPIGDDGAMEVGTHKFCSMQTGECSGLGEFTTIWRKTNNQWQATRMLSYGHRPIE